MPVSQVPFAGISNPVDFRNIVINGDMQIAQRNTSVASITGAGYHTLDRWKFEIDSFGTWTMSQSTDVPSGQGFANSLKLDCTAADASPSANDFLILQQIFEGQNLQYLKKGTANALPLTASFWVKSTKTGTFIVELVDMDNTRSISRSYTVNTTNTWEFKTITFPGDTTGAFTNDNGESLRFSFWLGAGSSYTGGTLATSWGAVTTTNRAVGQVNIADSTSNDFLITGVQLEAGEQASGFEFMPIDVNLARCQRYFCKTFNIETAPANNVSNVGNLLGTNIQTSSYEPGANWRFPVVMRATPTIVMYNPGAGTTGQWYDGTNSTANARALNAGASGVEFDNTGTTVAGNRYKIQATAAIEL